MCFLFNKAFDKDPELLELLGFFVEFIQSWNDELASWLVFKFVNDLKGSGQYFVIQVSVFLLGDGRPNSIENILDGRSFT